MDERKPSQENVQRLQTAMKAVGQAIQLDSNGNDREAYLHYLNCMQYISQCLLQDARLKVSQQSAIELKTKTSQKMVKLSQQCSERVADIMANMEETPVTSLAMPPPLLIPTLTPPPLPPLPLSTTNSIGHINPALLPPVPSNLSQSLPTHVAVVRPTRQQPGQQSRTVPSSQTAWQRDEQLGPLEKAYRENRQLMAAYKSRLNRMHTSKNKAMVNLTFQRRLMENMAIAKAREASLAKKIKERQLRLQEQAAQTFSSSGQPTKEEMELRMVYASILEYDNMKSWLQEWRQRLQEAPRDLKLIHDLITKILSCDEHPLSQLLKRYQITIYHKIMPLIQKEIPSIEEIRVPYRDVVALELQEPRTVPEGGFTTPDELDESVDEMLAKRLHALRENSSSSVESEMSTDAHARAFSQMDSAIFSASEMSDEVLDDLLTDDDGHRDHDDKSEANAESADVLDDAVQNGETERSDDDDDNELVANKQEDPCGIKEEASSSSDEAQTKSTKSDDDDDDILKEDVGEDKPSEVIDRMREIVGEVREDVEKALEEGEKLCQDLEKGEVKTEEKEEGDLSVVTKDQSKEDNSNVGNQVEDERTKDEASQEASQSNKNELRTKDDSEAVDSDDAGNDDERTCQETGKLQENQSAREDGETVDHQDEPSSSISAKDETLNDEANDVVKDEEDEDTPEVDESIQRPGEEKEQAGGGDKKKTSKSGDREKIAEMRVEAIKRHLKSISKDVLMFTERLQSLLVAMYEQLKTPAAKEQCISVLEAFFFKDIWQPLLMLFRRYNYYKEESAAIAMTKYQDAMPQHIGVHEKFCLLIEGAVQDSSQSSESYPYQQAVQELCKLQGYTCPLQKLECLVRVSRVIIECVEDFHESQGKPRQSPETSVGCDDLLPILSYVLIKSSMPQIVSECSAMEEFIHEGYLFGEEGYCLTTCQTALSYVLRLGSSEDPPS